MFSVVVTHTQNIDACYCNARPAFVNISDIWFISMLIWLDKAFYSSGVVHVSQQSTWVRAPLPRTCRDGDQDAPSSLNWFIYGFPCSCGREEKDSAKQGHPQRGALLRSVAGKEFHGLKSSNNNCNNNCHKACHGLCSSSSLVPSTSSMWTAFQQNQTSAAPRKKLLPTSFCT